MSKLYTISIICLLVCNITMANERSAQMSAAQKKTQDALLEVPSIKNAKGKLEDFTYKNMKNTTGISRDHVGYIIPVVTFVNGTVDTKKIKKMGWSAGSVQVRPDVFYNMKNKETRGEVGLKWSWK